MQHIILKIRKNHQLDYVHENQDHVNKMTFY